MIISCSAAIAARSTPTSRAGAGGLASTSTPPQPHTPTSGSTAAAAITNRRRGTAAKEPPPRNRQGAGPRRLLRVVVDADGGVTLDDIALVSQELSATLDRAAAMGEMSYTLEVSSPGVDRPLTEPKHWRRAAGRLVTVPLRSRTHSAPDARADAQVVTGRITGTDASGVRLDVEGESREFGYSELGPGRIQIEFAPLDAQLDDGERGPRGPGPAALGAEEEGPDGH